MGIDWNQEEKDCGDKLLDVMDTIIHDWKLKYNHDELVRAVHTIQLFIWQKALQRTESAGGNWYGE